MTRGTEKRWHRKKNLLQVGVSFVALSVSAASGRLPQSLSCPLLSATTAQVTTLMALGTPRVDFTLDIDFTLTLVTSSRKPA